MQGNFGIIQEILYLTTRRKIERITIFLSLRKIQSGDSEVLIYWLTKNI